MLHPGSIQSVRHCRKTLTQQRTARHLPKVPHHAIDESDCTNPAHEDWAAPNVKVPARYSLGINGNGVSCGWGIVGYVNSALWEKRPTPVKVIRSPPESRFEGTNAASG